MKTYICHWTKLVDRKNNLLPILEAQGFSDVEWIESYDTETWNKEEIEREYPNVFGLTPDNRWNSTRRHLKHSEISLLLKHCYIIEQIAKSDDPYGLVLEDDVVLCDNFLSQLQEYIAEMPEDWDVGWSGDCCNLSLYHYYKDQYIEGQKIYSKDYSRCTHCFVLSKKGANIILEDLKNACESSDFYYNYVIDKYSLKNYWFEPPLATQNSIYGSTIQG